MNIPLETYVKDKSEECTEKTEVDTVVANTESKVSSLTVKICGMCLQTWLYIDT